MNTNKPSFMKKQAEQAQEQPDVAVEEVAVEAVTPEQAKVQEIEVPEVAQANVETLDEIMKAARTVTAKMQSSRPAGVVQTAKATGPAPDGYYSHLVTYIRPKGGKPVLAQRVRGRSYWPFTVSKDIQAELVKAVEAGTVYVKGTPPRE